MAAVEGRAAGRFWSRALLASQGNAWMRQLALARTLLLCING